jgi:hypothetical protein
MGKLRTSNKRHKRAIVKDQARKIAAIAPPVPGKAAKAER